MDESATPALEVRERTQLSLPAKVTTLLALLALVWALYQLFTPVLLTTSNGIFDCGRVVAYEQSDFQRSVCKSAGDSHVLRAIALGVSALVLGGGGALLFGTERVVDARRASAEDEDGRDRPEAPERTSRLRRRRSGSESIDLRGYDSDAARPRSRSGRRSDDDWDA